ncbi:unnamed protein product [Vitrella brassicaformis CCMP3155]|uniref:E2F/DP family winged-helix DNA-binding domain-containing protein n=1 Tax=Vitrella brassicaformis (strain CCMP3155) TaxID=1169540 RepID=A0A0G4G2I8_VITBC|nr:unnamed protein product [Vitrella brassicaformis CCMP3155]|eukprot:CEM22494.1 unnamed protein product [Vitrella brassicaformis CCMP3155]
MEGSMMAQKEGADGTVASTLDEARLYPPHNTMPPDTSDLAASAQPPITKTHDAAAVNRAPSAIMQDGQETGAVVTAVVSMMASSMVSNEAGEGAVEGMNRTSSESGDTTVMLTRRLLELVQGLNRQMDLAEAEKMLQVHRSRLYDITDVLEGIGVITKTDDNIFKCTRGIPPLLLSCEMSVEEQLASLKQEEAMLDQQLAQAASRQKETLDEAKQQGVCYVPTEYLHELCEYRDKSMLILGSPFGTKVDVVCDAVEETVQKPDGECLTVTQHIPRCIHISSPTHTDPIHIDLLDRTPQNTPDVSQPAVHASSVGAAIQLDVGIARSGVMGGSEEMAAAETTHKSVGQNVVGVPVGCVSTKTDSHTEMDRTNGTQNNPMAVADPVA